MLIDLNTVPAPADLAGETVVVGAGAVGIAMAVRLARAGERVLLLEAGPAGLVDSSQSLFQAARSIGPARFQNLHTGRFRMLGGTTNFWGGQLRPLSPGVFGPRPWIGDDTAWPIDAQTLGPWHEQVYELLGMGGMIETDEGVLARLRQQLPPLHEDLRYFFTRWAPQPNFTLLFEEDLRTRPELICYTNAQVAGIELDDGKVQALRVVDGARREHRVRAGRVVLANGTIEIARLLMSPVAGGGAAPWQESPWLGRGFVDHLEATAGTLRLVDKKQFRNLFENVVIDGFKYQPKVALAYEAQKRERMLDICAMMMFNSAYQDHVVNAKIFLRSFLSGRFDRDLRSYPAKIRALIRYGLPMALRYLRSNRIYSVADGGIDMRVVCEQIPIPDSRLVRTERKDALGLPVADLEWRLDGRELDTIAGFAERMKAFFEDNRLAEVALDPDLAARSPVFLEKLQDTSHQMGMARMGTSVRDGVVDRDLRVFGTGNLYVAGAAVYPSTGFPNPTLTAMALGLRLADHLRGKAAP